MDANVLFLSMLIKQCANWKRGGNGVVKERMFLGRGRSGLDGNSNVTADGSTGKGQAFKRNLKLFPALKIDVSVNTYAVRGGWMIWRGGGGQREEPPMSTAAEIEAWLASSCRGENGTRGPIATVPLNEPPRK